MRTVLIALLLVGLVAVTAVVSSRMRQSRSNAKDREVMRMLRQRALQTPPDQMVPGATDDEPFAVLMDIGFPGATATLFAASTGDASLYLSSGGGVIGGIGHENVRTAAIHLVKIAADWRGDMKPTTDFSYPPTGRVRFYVRTRSAVYMAERSKEELEEKKDGLWPLYYAGQNVLTQLRTVSPDPGG